MTVITSLAVRWLQAISTVLEKITSCLSPLHTCPHGCLDVGYKENDVLQNSGVGWGVVATAKWTHRILNGLISEDVWFLWNWLKPDFWLYVTVVLFSIFRLLKISVMLLPILHNYSENDFQKTLRDPKWERDVFFKLKNKTGPYTCSWLFISHEKYPFSN